MPVYIVPQFPHIVPEASDHDHQGLGLLVVMVFRSFFPDDIAQATDQERTIALQNVIYTYTLFTLLAVPFVWMFVPEPHYEKSANGSTTSELLRRIRDVASLQSVWLQAAIIVAAYVGYKGLDNYSLFAFTAYGMNEVEAAELTAYSVWIRPVAAVGAGASAEPECSGRVSRRGAPC